MDKCNKCGKVTNNTYLLYPKNEYPKKDNRITVCGHCMPDKANRMSAVSYEVA